MTVESLNKDQIADSQPPDEAHIYINEDGTETPDDDRSDLPPVIMIRRTTFNYIIIAVVCTLLGIFIGAYSAFRVERANRFWVSEAISEAFAAESETFAGMVSASRAPDLNDPSSRFEVEAVSTFFKGGAEAPVEIIEFGDFNCGFCGRFHNDTLPQIMESYGDNVRYVYRDYPILAANSVTAALAARCAGEQGKYWEYHDLLFAHQSTFGQTGAFGSFASQLELDTEAFSACMDEQAHLTAIADDYRTAQSLGIRGTPAFFINGRPVSGAQPFQVFAGVINEELQAAGIDTEALVPADSLLPDALLPADQVTN